MTTNKQFKKSPRIQERQIFAARVILLLAVTLFISCGAVAGANYGTIFPYQLSNDIEGTWSHAGSTITAIPDSATGMYYFANSNIIEGQYTRGGDKITVKYPYAAISGIATFSSGAKVIVSDGGTFNAYKGTSASFQVTNDPSGAQASDLLITYPDGVSILAGNTEFTWNYGMKTGEYKINAVFDKDDFVNGVPADFLVSKRAFTFKAVNPGSEVSIDTNQDAIVKGKAVALTVTGVPGVKYTIDCDALDIISTGTAKEAGPNSFIMPQDGKAVVYGVFTETGTFNVNLISDSDEKATISYEPIDNDKIPTTPASTNPTDTKPAATETPTVKPTETKPTETKPTETKPTGTDSETQTVIPTETVIPTQTQSANETAANETVANETVANQSGRETPTETAKSPFCGAALMAVAISGIIACVVYKRRG